MNKQNKHSVIFKTNYVTTTNKIIIIFKFCSIEPKF